MKQKIHFPIPGQRIIRSVCAVLICFIIYFIRNKNGIPFYSCLAVLQCIQPYKESTIQMSKKRTIGTLVGAFYGFLVILMKISFAQTILNDSFVQYILISLFTGIVLYSTVLLKIQNTSYFSCVVFLSITVNHIGDQNPLLFVFNRVCDTLIGIGIALFVNSMHLPRHKQNDILFISGIDQTLMHPAYGLSPYSQIELNRFIESGAKFTVSTIRTPASVREALPDIHFNIPIIAMNGAVLYDIKENVYLEKEELSYTQAHAILSILERMHVSCFINTIYGNSHVIYYNELKNEAEIDIYNKLRQSPYRNYIQGSLPENRNVVYIMLIEKNDIIQKILSQFQRMSSYNDYQFLVYPSDDYKDYSYIKIYRKDVSREHMKHKLLQYLHLDTSISFGSNPAYCDVCIHNANHNEMVKELKKLYEPCTLFHH